MKHNQKKYLFSILAFAILLATSFVIADHVITTSDGGTSYSVNDDTESLFNITVNNTDELTEANITQVNITIPDSFTFTLDSNATDAGTHTFSNTSTVLSWSNDGLVMNLTSQNFWFNATPSIPGDYNLTVTTTNSTGPSLQTNIAVTVNDTTAPIVTLPVYVNGTKKTNLQTLTLNISVTDPDSNISACVVNVNGTNQTIAYDSGWCNTTSIALTGLADGNHTIYAYANNSFNLFGLNDSYVVEINNTLYDQLAVDLGTSADFTILSKTAVSTTGATAVIGNIGVSPTTSTALTGFGLVLDSSGCFSTSSLVAGKLYASDYDTNNCTTPAMLTTAVSDMEAAYTDANGRTNPIATELGSGNIGGMTLAPGFYDWSTGVTIPTDVTLSGDSNDVWIFSISGNLEISSATSVILSGGAQPSNIFWAVAGTTTLGTTSVFKGNILAGPGTSTIALQDSATLTGRALGQKDVTLIANTVSTEDVSPSAPGITLPFYTNGTLKSNSQTLTLNIAINDTGTGVSACVVNVNGTNQTIAYDSGWCNTTSIALTGLANGNHTIFVYANDTLGATALNDSYVVQIDSTTPTITLISPADLTSSTTNSYNFTFNVTDNQGISSCDLILNDAITDTNNNIITNDTNGIYKTSMAVGTYKWSVNCTDNAGNIANSAIRALTVQAVEEETSSGSSGGGYPLFRPTQEELDEGYQKLMRENFRITFEVAGQSHRFTVIEITRTAATITIASETQVATLQVGETKKFELNGDGYYDFLVKLDSIDYGNGYYPSATFTVQTISEKIEQDAPTRETAPYTPETQEETQEPGITGQIIGEGETGYTWMIILIIAIALGLTIYYLVRKRKKRKYVHHRNK